MPVATTLVVGMADIQVVKGGGVLSCLGLGSCIGLCALDPHAQVAGMVHIKDIYGWVGREGDFKLASLLRRPLFVAPTTFVTITLYDPAAFVVRLVNVSEVFVAPRMGLLLNFH